MYQRHKLGKEGENIACLYLKNIGYTIITKNFHSKKYEIDIIAKDKDELVFIEVKTRGNNLYGKPAESIKNYKIKNIYKAAKYYLCTTRQEDNFVRIDVIEIYLHKKHYYIRHIKQII